MRFSSIEIFVVRCKLQRRWTIAWFSFRRNANQSQSCFLAPLNSQLPAFRPGVVVEHPQSTVSPGRQMRLHVATQYGVDSRLITLLPSKPFEKISVQADRDCLLGFPHDHSRVFPEILSVFRASGSVSIARRIWLSVRAPTRFQWLPLADDIRVRFSFMPLCPPG